MMDLVTSWVTSAGYAGVFALMFLENLFPPIPSEVIMPLAGFAAARGELTLGGVVVAGVLGTIVGNAVWFEGARAFGTRRTRALVARFGGWVGVRERDIEEGERALRRWGPWAVFLGRMMPGIRTLISIPAGLIEMPRLVFYGLTTVGTILWVGGLAVLGWWLEDQYTLIEGYIDPLSKPLLGLALLVVAWWTWRAWRRRD